MSFPTWSWSPPRVTSESGKDTDDDVGVTPSPASLYQIPSSDDSASSLPSFLHSFLPAAAIRCFAEQCARKAAAQEARQFRRKLPVHSEQRLHDFADWTAALSERYEALISRKPPRATLRLTEVKDLTEVFYARWLRLQVRCPRHDLVASNFVTGEESRQRRCCHQTSQKKLKWSFFRDTKASLPQPSLDMPRRTEAAEGHTNRENVQATNAPSHAAVAEETLGGTSKILCHASAYLEPSVFVYGGLTPNGCSGGLWSLDLSFEHSWQRIEPTNEHSRPSPRYNHSLISWRHYLVLFGGDRGPGHSDDLWYFDTITRSWDRISLEVEQRGLRPGARAGHSAVLFQNQMIIFGGWRGSDGFSDAWSWDLESRHWRLITPHIANREFTNDEGLCRDDQEGRAPQARHWHVAAVFGKFMYIHGGYGPWGPLSEVWKLDLVGKAGWSHVPTTGTTPQARCRHSGAAIDGDRWALIGGKDALGSYFDDLHLLDTRRLVWQKVTLFTPPRSLAAANCHWWNSSQIVRQLPSLHCHSVCYHEATGTLVVTGGCDGDCTARDSTILLKRSPTATLLFEQWRDRRSPGFREGTLPGFISDHPTPYSQEICKFL